VAEIGKAGAGHQPDIARSNHRNAHRTIRFRDRTRSDLIGTWSSALVLKRFLYPSRLRFRSKRCVVVNARSALRRLLKHLRAKGKAESGKPLIRHDICMNKGE
jgi:hypothetical protein